MPIGLELSLPIATELFSKDKPKIRLSTKMQVSISEEQLLLDQISNIL